MSCNNCSTQEGGVPKGCKSNGSCGTGSCDKLTVFDWLSNMELPTGQKPFNIVEIRFKNGRKHFYKNEKNLQLSIGEVVAVEGNPGHDIGTISLTGELVKIQMKKKKIAEDSDAVKKIYRKATAKDMETWEEARSKEIETQRRGREIIIQLGLKMKLSDVEYQGDGNKATFYYTAEERVDFRQLIRDLASAFSIRVEMKQVGLRQEASRLGGIGSCGRELCCSTWLTDFRKVNTAAARYQQLSLNPQKLAGQCGKLKCCLNYELDTYLDALKEFPTQNTVLKTEKGLGVFVKMDIFKQVLWYTYKEDKSKWYKLTLEQVKEIIEENKKGNSVESLEDFDAENIEDTKIDFENVVGQDSLTRFDEPKRKNSRRRKKSRTNHTRDNVQNKKNRGVSKKSDNESRETRPKQERGNGNNPRRKSNNRKRPNPTGANQPEGQKPTENKAPVKGGATTNRKPNNRKRPPKPKNTSGNTTLGATKEATSKAEESKMQKPRRKPTNRKRPNRTNNGPAKSE